MCRSPAATTETWLERSGAPVIRQTKKARRWFGGPSFTEDCTQHNDPAHFLPDLQKTLRFLRFLLCQDQAYVMHELFAEADNLSATSSAPPSKCNRVMGPGLLERIHEFHEVKLVDEI